MLCSLMDDKVTVPSQPLPSLGPSSSRGPTSHSLLIRTKAESNLPARGPDPADISPLNLPSCLILLLFKQISHCYLQRKAHRPEGSHPGS